MLKISFLIYNQMLATSLTLPMEQLKAAVTMAKISAPKEPISGDIDFKLIAETSEPITTQTGLSIKPSHTLKEMTDTPDIIYIPALWRNPSRGLKNNPNISPWLVEQHKRGAILASVGTGCWFLANGGLLDGKPATTHWYFFQKFHQEFPEVQLKRKHFITQADNIYCTGSVNSLADLTIHFIQRYFGNTIANQVERHFFHELRANYGSSRTFRETQNAHADEDIALAQQWLLNNYGKEVVIASLAAQLGMHIRTFNRRFKAATATTPAQYLRVVRMNTARDLLQNTNLSINEICYRVGYQDNAHFSKLFKDLYEISPTQYRTTVRAKLFKPEN